MRHLRNLNQQGFDHVVALVLFVVIFGIVGSAYLIYSHAQSWSGELQLGLDKNLCLDNLGGSRASGNTIDQYSCNGGTAQKWTINEMKGYTDRFTLENDQGTCADDWGDKVSTSSGNVALKTYACNSSDKAQQWEWEGSQLENVTSHGCINDPANSKLSGKALIVYSCSGRPSNELWYEAAQGKNTTVSSSSSSSSTTSASGSGTTSGSTPSGSGSTTTVGGGSGMVVGMNINGMTSDTSTDFAGAANYMRVDLKSWGQNASTFSAAGIKVDDLLQGPYSTSGISGLGSATTWANNALGWYKTDGCTPTICPMVEVLNEPGGHWFWGNNAMTASNASAYDSILVATYNAFKTAYGSSTPKVLASFDGGMSDGSGGWGNYMWQANKSIGNYMDGITVHPYNQQSTDLGYQTNVTGSYSSAKSLSGRSIPVYITEIGWQTTPATADGGDPPQSGVLTMSTAQQCSNVYNYVSWARGLCYVNAVMFFDLSLR